MDCESRPRLHALSLILPHPIPRFRFLASATGHQQASRPPPLAKSLTLQENSGGSISFKGTCFSRWLHQSGYSWRLPTGSFRDCRTASSDLSITDALADRPLSFRDQCRSPQWVFSSWVETSCAAELTTSSTLIVPASSTSTGMAYEWNSMAIDLRSFSSSSGTALKDWRRSASTSREMSGRFESCRIKRAIDCRSEFAPSSVDGVGSTSSMSQSLSNFFIRSAAVI